MAFLTGCEVLAGFDWSGWNHRASASVASFNPELFHSIVISRFQKTKLQGLLRFSPRGLPHSESQEASPTFKWWALGSASTREEHQRLGDLVLPGMYFFPRNWARTLVQCYFLLLLTPLMLISWGVFVFRLHLQFPELFTQQFLVSSSFFYHICYLFAEFLVKIVEATLFDSWYILKCLYFAFFLNHNFSSVPEAIAISTVVDKRSAAKLIFIPL